MGEGVEVQFYSVKLIIYDIDAALGYVFSTCPLPTGATPADNYLPLLAIYCKFLTLLIPGSPPPKTACVVIRVPPGNVDAKVITFGSTIRKSVRAKAQKPRMELLKRAYETPEFPKNPTINFLYGHCAETYPFICYIKGYALSHPQHSVRS